MLGYQIMIAGILGGWEPSNCLRQKSGWLKSRNMVGDEGLEDT